MSELLEKYKRRAQELREQGKTGRECEYCGGMNTVEKDNREFCKGCGAERKKYAALLFGIPVDLSDTIPLMIEFGEINRYAPR